MTTLEDSSALYSSANPSAAAPWLFTTEAGLLTALHDPFAPYFHSYARAARRAQPGGQLGADWDLWENLLFWDDRAPERPYTTLPLSYYARGIEMAAVRSDWSRRAVWAAFKSGPYINFPDNGEEYFDKGSLAIVNGSRPLLVNANGALLRDTPGTSDGDRYYQPIYDDLFSDTGRRDIFNIFYTDRPAPLGQSNRSTECRCAHPHRPVRGSRRVCADARRPPGGHVSAFRRADNRRVDPHDRVPATRHVHRLRPYLGHVGRCRAVAGIPPRRPLTPVPGPAAGVQRYDVAGRGGYAGSVYTVLPAGHRDSVERAVRRRQSFTRLEVRPGAGAPAAMADDLRRGAHGGALRVPLRDGRASRGPGARPDGDTAVLLGEGSRRTFATGCREARSRSLVTGLRPARQVHRRERGGDRRCSPGPRWRASNAGVLNFSTG